LEIDEEIRSGRYPNSEDLAKKLELNSRTIKRYIDYLKRYYKAPISYNPSKRGFYYTQSNFFMRNVMLTQEESNIVLDGVFIDDKGGEIESNFVKSIKKIVRVESKEKNINSTYIDSDKGKYLNDWLSRPRKLDIVNKLNSAIKNKKIVEIDYWMSDKRDYVLCNIKPLHVFFKKHFYYLLALRDTDNDKPGIYAIHKIRNIQTMDSNFEISADFMVSDYLKQDSDVFPSDNKMYLFELSFPKDIASTAIEKTYDKNQTIKLLEDGTVFVSFRSVDLYEIFYWILGEGRKVKVLNPPELIEMIKKEVKKILKYYSLG